MSGSLTGSNLSTLNLNGIYINNGARFDQLSVGGSLDLAGLNDSFIMTINPYLLRPYVGTAVESGSLPLVTTGAGLTGTFTSGPTFLQDNLGWEMYTGAFTTAAALPINTYYLEYTANEYILHYKVEGTVPEPATMGFVAVGMALLRGLRRRTDLEYT